MSAHRRPVVAVALVVAAGLAAWGAAGATAGTPATPHASEHSTDVRRERMDPVELRQDMRRLWEDHVTWTRLFVVSAIADLPDLDAATGRLLRNQADIGDAFAEFYGDDAGDELTSLLRDHILIAADLLAAAKAGDAEAVALHRQRWDENADAIAGFLADLNPAWPFAAVSEMMHAHLDQTLAEVSARLASDWDADVAAYEEIHLHILEMADVLADGIVEQFPRRFSR